MSLKSHWRTTFKFVVVQCEQTINATEMFHIMYMQKYCGNFMSAVKARQPDLYRGKSLGFMSI